MHFEEWCACSKDPALQRDRGIFGVVHTGFLFLQRHLIPINLHSVSQLHPKFGLLLWRQSLPSLFNSSKCRVRDGMSGPNLGLARHRRLVAGGESGSQGAR